MKWYVGTPGSNQVLVHIDNRHYKLNPCYHLVNHSPDGFSWGYGGSGPSQLALAICVDALQDEDKAMKIYRKFKFKVIVNLPMNEAFRLNEEEVKRNIEELNG